MNSVSTISGSDKPWRALVAEGKKVNLLAPGGGYWTVFDCETELIAQHIVRELQAWAKSSHQNEEYNRLCRAGD
jgi:hypothetical protein